MGLYADIEETKNIWKKASWQTRLILFVFLFLTVSSITSVADTVFKWKGFILDGVVFYQAWIRNPIVSTLSFIDIPPYMIDLAIPNLTALSIYFKVNDRSPLTRKWWHNLLLFPLLYFGGYALAFISDNYFYDQRPFVMLIFFVGALGLAFELSSIDRKLYFCVFGGILLFVFLLAAINSGLTKAS